MTTGPYAIKLPLIHDIFLFSLPVFFTYVFSFFRDVCVRDIERPFCVICSRSSLWNIVHFQRDTFNRFSSGSITCLSWSRRCNAPRIRFHRLITQDIAREMELQIKYCMRNEAWSCENTPLVMTSGCVHQRSFVSLSFSFLNPRAGLDRTGQDPIDYRHHCKLILHTAGRERYGIYVRYREVTDGPESGAI